MTKTVLLAALGAVMLATPAIAQSVGSCASDGAVPESRPAWVLFDLGSAILPPDARPAIAQAVATAIARQSSKVYVFSYIGKLGDKAFNENNARFLFARAQAVASELVRQGLPPGSVVIASDPEGSKCMLSLSSHDAPEIDRRVAILFR
jgi:outer membrane protein OmpA-like peptidoglycan-associated protein